MSKKNYRIDFAANTVTVTKKFLEEAESNITSTAFRDMKALRAMGLTIVVKEAKRAKSKHISYGQMVHYISCVENSEFYMARFAAVKNEAASKNEQYNRVLKWFNKTFPHFYDMPEFTSDNKIRVTTADSLHNGSDSRSSRNEQADSFSILYIRHV